MYNHARPRKGNFSNLKTEIRFHEKRLRRGDTRILRRVRFSAFQIQTNFHSISKFLGYKFAIHFMYNGSEMSHTTYMSCFGTSKQDFGKRYYICNQLDFSLSCWHLYCTFISQVNFTHYFMIFVNLHDWNDWRNFLEYKVSWICFLESVNFLPVALCVEFGSP